MRQPSEIQCADTVEDIAAMLRAVTETRERVLPVAALQDTFEQGSYQARRESTASRLRSCVFGEPGYISLDLGMHGDNESFVTNLATSVCICAGEPLLLYDREPYWERLTVDMHVNPCRTHGVGENPLHIDLVDRARPPAAIAFLGVRSDPLGGGYSELSDLAAAVRELSADDHRVLANPVFHYWADAGVFHVGKSLNRFPIIPANLDTDVIRFTSKMIPHLDDPDVVVDMDAVGSVRDIKLAMGRFYERLRANVIRTLVDRNRLLLFDQRRFAHSRSRLGQPQAEVEPGSRRLLLQAYLHRRGGSDVSTN